MATSLGSAKTPAARTLAASGADWRWRRTGHLFWQVSLGALVAALVGLFLPFSIVLFPMLALASAIVTSKTLLRPDESIRRRDLPAMVCLLCVLLPSFWLGFGAPLRALALAAHGIWAWVPAELALEKIFAGDRVLAAHVDLLAAACGVLLGAGVLLRDGVWRVRQLRQLRNVPRSSARAAALGLVELHGVARRAPEAAPERVGSCLPGVIDAIPRDALLWLRSVYGENAEAQQLQPFLLEDASGRILVDPRGAAIRRGIWSAQFGLRLCEVVLTQRVVPQASGVPEQRWLEEGDPVYVLGSVERNPEASSRAAGSDALVVRRTTQPGRPSLLERVFASGPRVETFTYRDVFFVSDTAERDARHQMWLGLRRTASLALLWVSASLWLGRRALELTPLLAPGELLARLF